MNPSLPPSTVVTEATKTTDVANVPLHVAPVQYHFHGAIYGGLFLGFGESTRYDNVSNSLQTFPANMDGDLQGRKTTAE
jgi:hypothetical protein